MTADVIVLGGRIYCDLVFSGMPSLPRPGTEIFSQKLVVNIGGPANTAVALRRLELRPQLLADLGTDFFSQYIRTMLQREDLDRSLIQNREYPTAAVTVALPCDGERALVSYIEPEQLPAYDPGILERSSARYLHICGMGTAQHHAELVRAAKAAGMVLLIDCACEDVDLADPVSRSLLGAVVPYGLLPVDDPLARRTVQRVEEELGGIHGGLHRYRRDTYYGGGAWVLLTAWLGWYYARAGELERAQALGRWVEAQATAEGDLPEQAPVDLNEPSYYPLWLEKWGPIASPLLWSHAQYIILRRACEAAGKGVLS